MIEKLIKLLGLGAEATEDQVVQAVATANANAKKLPEKETALSTANAAKQTAEANLATVTTERDQLKTANAQLTASRDQLVDATLNAIEAVGKITPAQRPDVKARFTANGANPVEIVKELTEKKPELNTKEIQINNNRVDVSTANARQVALHEAVSKRMTDDQCDYGTAFERVQRDPKFKQLFESMQDPTKEKKAA